MARVRPRKAPMADAADASESSYWKAIKSGDFIGIRDAEAFESRLAAGGAGDDGAPDYTVGEVRTFALRGPEGSMPHGPAAQGDKASLGEYRFIELLQEGAGSLYLGFVEAEGGFELRLYFIPEGFAGGTRDELIDRGETWLFLPPANPEDFKSSELEYAPYPDVPEMEAEGASRKLVFGPKGPGKSLYGEALDTEAPVIITEYVAEAPEGGLEPANPLLLVLEEGWMRPDGSQPEEGGCLTLLLGKVLRTGDIELYPA
jgi:hypothetical protein